MTEIVVFKWLHSGMEVCNPSIKFPDWAYFSFTVDFSDFELTHKGGGDTQALDIP